MRDAVDDILDQWSRERPDLDRAPMGIVGRVARLARACDEAIRHNFAAFVLQPDEFDVLATLRRSAPEEALNPRDLLESMMVSSGNHDPPARQARAAGAGRASPPTSPIAAAFASS
jgi:hypothetical protein